MTHIDLINFALGMWVQPMLMIALLMLVSRHMFMFSAASRHWYFVCVLAAVAAALLLKIVLPNIQFPAIPLSMSYWLAVPIVNIISPLSIFVGIYLLGVLWFLSYQIMGFMDIAKLSARSKEADTALNAVLKNVEKHFNFKRKVNLKVTTELSGPVVWGQFKPTILLPATYVHWDEGRLTRVLTHECAHIERNDFIVKVTGKWICAFLWIVPLVWWVNKKIEWYAELSCDDKVIAIYDARDAYAEDLLSITSSRDSLTWALAFIQSSKLYLRLQYVLDARNYRESVTTKQMVLQFFSLFVLVVPLSMVSLSLSFDKWSPSEFSQTTNETVGDGVLEAQSLIEMYDERIENIQHLKSLIKVIPESRERPEETVSVFYNSQDMELGSTFETLDDNVAIKKEELVGHHEVVVPVIEVQGVVPLNIIMPNYPKKALLRGIEGKVVVAFDVMPDGSVNNPEIIYSGNTAVFNAEVIKAIKKSMFSPMLLEGKPIITKNMTETYYFRLSTTEKATMQEESENGINL